MNAAAIVEVSLGILGRVTEGISQAIAAARSNNEDEAFDLLERALTETAAGIMGMRAKLKENKEAALKALADKFPSDG
jgi:DNA-binding transcriptional MocR family regulator